MADKNIQLQESGNYLFPKTKSTLVTMVDGRTVEQAITSVAGLTIYDSAGTEAATNIRKLKASTGLTLNISGDMVTLGSVVDTNHTHAIANVTGLQTALDSKATKSVATTTVDGLMLAADKVKLNGIATGANNYIHPDNHPASILIQDASNRLVTDTEKAIWNAKADYHDIYSKIETDARIQTVIGSAPAALDTLKELADALGNDVNFSTTVTTQLGNKFDKSGQTANRIVITDPSGNVTTTSGIDTTELSYLDNVTSNIQTQLNTKLSNTYLSNKSTSDPNVVDDVGVAVHYLASGATSKPTGTDHALFTMSYSNAWSAQMASDWRTNEWYVRSQNNTAWGSWQNLWHSGNFTPSSKVDVTTYTASDILTKLLTVDGIGSGLDADKFDTLESNQFLRSDTPSSLSQTTATPLILERTGSSANTNLAFKHVSATTYLGIDSTGILKVGATADLAAVGNKIWHAGDTTITATTFSGNATTATKWATPRTITLGGDLTGNVSIDGSANVTLTATVTDSSHTHVATNITEDATHRFVTDTEKTTWDGKAASTHEHATYTKNFANGNFYNGTVGGGLDLGWKSLYRFTGTDRSGNGTATSAGNYYDAGTIHGIIYNRNSNHSHSRVDRYQFQFMVNSWEGTVRQDIAKLYIPAGMPDIIRIVKYAINDYELQIRSDVNYRHTSFEMWENNYNLTGIYTALVDYIGSDTVVQDKTTYNTIGDAPAFSDLRLKPTTLSGYGITDAASSSHIGATGTAHGVVTTSINGFMSSTDKSKLDGIATSANNYTHPTYTYATPVVDATTTLTTIPFISTLTQTNGHVTGGTMRKLVAGTNVGIVATADGNITISSTDTNTTYSVFNTTTNGLVPMTTTSNTTDYLRRDGTWATPPDTNTTYAVFTSVANGLTPLSGGGTTKYLRADGTWVVPPDTNTTYPIVNTTTDGLVPKTVTSNTTDYLRRDGTWATPPDTNTVYSHPAYNGDDISLANTGATVLANLTVTTDTQGHVTAASATTRALTLANLGYTGATNANYFTYAHPNHSGDVTSVADGATTIAANVVTNAKLADMATSTIKGRVTAATGDPEDLTVAQVRTLLQDASNRFVTDAEKTTWNAKASTAVATTGANGLMSSTDKTKLDNLAAGSVTSVAGKTGVVTLVASDVGALATTGGTISGNVTLNNNIQIQSKKVDATVKNLLYLSASDNINVGQSDTPLRLNASTLIYWNGTTAYNILHTGNFNTGRYALTYNATEDSLDFIYT
jgi:hypothetical protein